MAMIHVNRSGTSLGVFPEEDVRAGLRAGRFAPADLGWREGMAQWQPLSQFAEFAADIPAETPTAPAAESATPPTSAIAAPGATSSAAEIARIGLPWEHREERGFFAAFIETLGQVLIKPDLAFKTMKVEGGFGGPLLYGLIGGCVGSVVSILFSMAMQSLGIGLGQKDAMQIIGVMGIGLVVFILLMPVFMVIGLFIGALVMHICLAIVGGANRPFETTFRVVAFAQGSVGPLQMLPVCGPFVAALWGLVVEAIGLARSHETDTWRGVVAVLLPFILCCGCFIALFVFGIAGGWGTSSH